MLGLGLRGGEGGGATQLAQGESTLREPAIHGVRGRVGRLGLSGHRSGCTEVRAWMPLGLETSFAELRAPRGLNQKKFAHANNEDFPHARLSRACRAHLSGGKGSG